jgi:EmrB/QacA subfamily drug resistance transporter
LTGSATPGLSARAWGTLLVLSAAIFLDGADVSLVGVALPSIKNSLHMSTSSLQWIVSAYVLGYGGFLLLGGRAADLFGRRRVFLVALGIFVVASALGGIANDGSLLIVTRFIKGLSAAFTAPAAFSLITTSFEEGPARNKALSVYSTTAATGVSLGLVLGGALTQIGWRWAVLLPAPVALATLLAAIRFVPADPPRPSQRPRIDFLGALSLTGGMLLLVYTLVEAPDKGWATARTLGSFAAVAVILGGFIAWEKRTPEPLIRLGIFRSSTLVRANLAVIGLSAWIGFQVIATLYMQQLRGWSALQTGLAIVPVGLMVTLLAPRAGLFVGRFGVPKLVVAGLLSASVGYALFVPIGLHSSYWGAMLPAFLLCGVGFGLAYPPTNIAAVMGVAPEEQGLAGGLITTSFQFGGALVLAVVTAAAAAGHGSSDGPQATLHGYHNALFIPVGVAAVGALAMLLRRPARGKPVALPVRDEQLEEDDQLEGVA